MEATTTNRKDRIAAAADEVVDTVLAYQGQGVGGPHSAIEDRLNELVSEELEAIRKLLQDALDSVSLDRIWKTVVEIVDNLEENKRLRTTTAKSSPPTTHRASTPAPGGAVLSAASQRTSTTFATPSSISTSLPEFAASPQPADTLRYKP